jgi:hypothetical protein
MSNDPNFLVEIISLILIPKKNQLMKEGLVVEQSTTPMNGSMEGLAEETKNCQPEVPQSAVSCRPRLTRVPSDRRNRTGPEPPWGKRRGVQEKEEGNIPFRKRKSA